MRFKRVVAVADFHSGHLVGLTPPAWQLNPKTKDPENVQQRKFAKIEADMWGSYVQMLRNIEPIDHVLYLGDGIDGDGRKSGATELITTDRFKQVDMAVRCLDTIRLFGRKKMKMVGVFGTPYHNGNQEDFEELVADRAGFEKIGGQEWPEVNGLVFDIKHFIGSSSVPHGGATAVEKDMLWNTQWAVDDRQPRCDVLVRAHTHTYHYSGDHGRVGMTLPGLEGLGSKYGSRKCRKIVHFGMVHYDIGSNGND